MALVVCLYLVRIVRSMDFGLGSGWGFDWFDVSCETSWSIAFFWVLVNLVVWSCFLVVHVGLLF